MQTFGRLDGFTYGAWVDDEDSTRHGEVILFVRRQDGLSQMVTVRSFWAYFFVKCLPGADERAFEAALVDLLDRHPSAQPGSRRTSYADVQVKVERDTRTIAFNYQGESPMFKVSATHPMVIAYMRDSILEGSICPEMMPEDPIACEADVEYPHRYALDNELRVGAWICYDATDAEEVVGASTCTAPSLLYEKTDAIRGISDEEELERGLRVSTRVMSFDIEVIAPPGIFPEAADAEYPVAQIACIFADLDGRPDAEILDTCRKVLLNLGTCDVSILGETFTKVVFSTQAELDAALATNDCTRSTVYKAMTATGAKVDIKAGTGNILVEFADEASLLYAFANLVRLNDIDVDTGYNTYNFDWQTIINRTKNLRLHPMSRCFSRIAGKEAYMRSNSSETKAAGFQMVMQPIMPGVAHLDMMAPIKADHKLRNYGLDAVSVYFLGPQHRKDDVKPRQIHGLFNGSPADRGRLGHYCVIDAELPLRLMLHLKTYVAYTEMARVCRVTYDTLVFRGQQAKVYAQLISKGRSDGYVMPYFKRSKTTGLAQDVGYEGATVIPPVVGFHHQPVTCLDFESLYPMIMRELNLCPTTHIPVGTDLATLGLTEDDVEKTQIGELFVRSTKRKGLMPRILKSLGQARSAAKAALKVAKATGNTHAAAVYDCRQLALKVSANSVYGFTGALTGKLPMKEIAASVTARGRWMIVQTIRIVDEVWDEKFATAYPGKRPVVVYGDTDSVFVKFPSDLPTNEEGDPLDLESAVAESFAFAVEVSKAVNRFFRKPQNLQVEKCYTPFYAIAKKRYLGLKFMFDEDNPTDIGKGTINISGLETRRRDNPMMIPSRLTTVISMIVEDKKPERALEYARDTVAAIVHGPCEARAIADAACNAAADVLRDEDGADAAAEFRANTYLEQLRRIVLPTYDDDAIDAEPLSPHDKESAWLKEFPALDTPEELEAVREAFRSVLRCNTTFGDYVISQKFSKRPEDYKALMAHMGVRLRMLARQDDPSDIIAGEWDYRSGDRIPYIVAPPSAIHTGTRLADRTEDPAWARENGIEPDPITYLERTLKPMVNILVGLVGDEAKTYRALMRDFLHRAIPARSFSIERFQPDIFKMLTGHTKDRRLPKPKVNPQAGAMLAFLVPN